MPPYRRRKLPHDLRLWIGFTQEAYFLIIDCLPPGSKPTRPPTIWQISSKPSLSVEPGAIGNGNSFSPCPTIRTAWWPPRGVSISKDKSPLGNAGLPTPGGIRWQDASSGIGCVRKKAPGRKPSTSAKTRSVPAWSIPPSPGLIFIPPDAPPNRPHRGRPFPFGRPPFRDPSQ